MSYLGVYWIGEEEEEEAGGDDGQQGNQELQYVKLGEHWGSSLRNKRFKIKRRPSKDTLNKLRLLMKPIWITKMR